MKLEAVDCVCSSLVTGHLLAVLEVKYLQPALGATCIHGTAHFEQTYTMCQ